MRFEHEGVKMADENFERKERFELDKLKARASFQSTQISSYSDLLPSMNFLVRI